MAKQGGYGVKLKVTVSAALTLVVGVLDVDFPKTSRELAEITAHDSSGGWAEYISTGYRSAGEMKATLAWDDGATTHAAVLTAFNSGASVNMSIEDPAGQEIIAFAGIVKEISRMAKQKEAYKAEVVIQPTGALTIT